MADEEIIHVLRRIRPEVEIERDWSSIPGGRVIAKYGSRRMRIIPQRIWVRETDCPSELFSRTDYQKAIQAFYVMEIIVDGVVWYLGPDCKHDLRITIRDSHGATRFLKDQEARLLAEGCFAGEIQRSVLGDWIIDRLQEQGLNAIQMVKE